jgi:hypothetical protein
MQRTIQGRPGRLLDHLPAYRVAVHNDFHTCGPTRCSSVQIVSKGAAPHASK